MEVYSSSERTGATCTWEEPAVEFVDGGRAWEVAQAPMSIRGKSHRIIEV
jgi:hypothetical protein